MSRPTSASLLGGGTAANTRGGRSGLSNGHPYHSGWADGRRGGGAAVWCGAAVDGCGPAPLSVALPGRILRRLSPSVQAGYTATHIHADLDTGGCPASRCARERTESRASRGAGAAHLSRGHGTRLAPLDCGGSIRIAASERTRTRSATWSCDHNRTSCVLRCQPASTRRVIDVVPQGITVAP